jgi:hypothetical protein
MQTIDQFLITHQSTELSAEFQITRNELCIELSITLQTTEQFLITELSAEFLIIQQTTEQGILPIIRYFDG